MQIPVPEIFLLGRVIFGGYFIMMGMNHFKNRTALAGYAASKKIPNPSLAVFGTGLLLSFGGTGVVLGIKVSLSLGLLLLFLVPTTLIMHKFWEVSDPNMKMSEMTNFLKNMALVGAIFMMTAISTPWVYSISL